MSIALTKALMVLNAWSAEARAKAAMGRKRKGGKNLAELESHATDLNKRIGLQREKKSSEFAKATPEQREKNQARYNRLVQLHDLALAKMKHASKKKKGKAPSVASVKQKQATDLKKKIKSSNKGAVKAIKRTGMYD